MAKNRIRRWLPIGAACTALALVVVASVAFAGPVGTASGFEDDDGNLVDDANAIPTDWNDFSAGNWTGVAPNRVSSFVAEGWTFTGLEDAQATTSDSAFAGGTKQDNNCPTVGTGKAPNKDDVKRVYLSTKTVSGNVYLNLAWVRIPQNTTSPSAHIGFEFNQGTIACASGGLVNRVAGDMLIVYDFEGGTTDIPTITLRRWITAGACEVGSSTAPCWGPAVNLTQLGFAEAKVNTTATAQDTVGPTTETLGISEFGEAGINLTGAGVFQPGVCAAFGKAYAVSRSSGNSGTAQMKDLVGPANFTLANCATVIIRKQTSPDEDPNVTNFGYTTNVTTNPATTTSPFTLQDDGVKTITNVVTGGGKTVTEDDPGPGYALTGIDCTASSVPAGNISTNTGTRTVTFSIAAGETLDCTFTNTKQLGALKIVKQSTKAGNPLVSQPGAVFSYDSTSVTDGGTGDEDATTGEVCVSGLATGTYSVSETSPPPGYGASTSGSQSVTVVAGTNCTDNEPTGTGIATFTNPPLADLLVRVDGQESGEIASTIDCGTVGGVTPATDPAVLDVDDLAPQTITCTIVIDP